MNHAIKYIDQMIDYIARGWCQGSAAKNLTGQSVSPTSYDACEFCIVGASRRVLYNWESILIKRKHVYEALCDCMLTIVKILKNRGYGKISNFNDSPLTKKEDVLSVLNEARNLLMKN